MPLTFILNSIVNMRKELPSKEHLWELYDYNPLTGMLINKVTRNRATEGCSAGTKTGDGYYTVQIDKKTYLVHRLIFKWVTGQEPSDTLEHNDDNGYNNVFWNLSDSNNRFNCITRELIRKGFIGQRDGNGAWRARINIAGTPFNLGSFKTKEEAHQAHLNAIQNLESNPNWRPPMRKTLQTEKSSKLRYVSPKDKRWQASYRYKKQLYYVGRFDTEEEAHAAAVKHRAQTIENDQIISQQAMGLAQQLITA